jgi:uncharacterized 2Fe-2S/4Fe-4S cluster protein (DUF4445 family)
MKVRFLPSNIEVEVSSGVTIMDALIEAGLSVDAPCGGRGVCRKCKVDIVDGNEKKSVLACMTKVESDLVVDISKQDEGHRILMGGISRAVNLMPAVKAFAVEVPKPSTKDLRSCWDRLKDAVAEKSGVTAASIKPDPAVVSGIYDTLTANDFKVEALLFGDEIVSVRPEGSPLLGLAFDIGTTTIAAYLVDLRTGDDLSQVSMLNPQVKYGADVIMRMKYSIENGLEGPTTAVREALAELTGKALAGAKAAPEDVFVVTIVGNTCMHHLFTGISPASLSYAPYTPAISEPMCLDAADFGFDIAPKAKLVMLPNIAGFVGADTVGASLAAEMDKKDELTLLIDIGTNGEMVMGTKDRLVACSTAAGPAFEGALISCGMRGADGAIDHIKLVDGRLDYSVIGGGTPQGICGSGLIDLLSELIRVGIVESGGRIVEADELDGTDSEVYKDNIISVEGQRAFLVFKGDKNEVYFTQKDVREVQLAKGAMAAGIEMMSDFLGVKSEDIKSVMIAGAFGSYMSPKSACGIALIPPVLESKVVAIGNAAGQGAKLALISRKEFERATVMAREINYLELAADPKFQDVFVDMLEFPEI